MKALAAGAAYAGLAFLAGVVLGIARTIIVAPAVGPLAAVLLEAPVILLVSWFACAWSMRRFAVPANHASRLATGSVALAVLLGLELALALAFGRPLARVLADYATSAGQVGLVAQLAFALVPLVQGRLGSR